MSEEEKKVINLSEDREQLNESFLRMFGSAVKSILKRMFGASSGDIPYEIKGNKREVKEFMDTIKKEKDYMNYFIRYGLDDPETLQKKGKLDKQIKKFERKTGIPWPFD